MTDFLHLLHHELLLSLVIVCMLILKLADRGRSGSSWSNLLNVLLLINFAGGLLIEAEGSLFNGMFRSNALLHFEKNILSLGLLLVGLLATPYLRNHRHSAEFHILIASTLLGMFFMLSAGHMLLFYVGLELATIPLAALAAFNLNKGESSEAGAKLILSSAFSSAFLLLGISFVYGTCGSLQFEQIALTVSANPLQLLAFTLVFAGFAFKLSVVPFHFWTADVYQGAPIPVAAYLSVVSKAAVTLVFISVLYSVFGTLQATWTPYLLITALLTIITGNLFAMRQDNIKRFLAFSSIAQVGFILTGILGANVDSEGIVLYFLLIYLFSNLAAFGVAGLISSATGKESINDYRGLHASNPRLAWTLTIALFSLAGVPPTAGFFGKLFLLTSGASLGNYLFIGIAALNMVVSMYYYLRIVKAMFMETTAQPIGKIPTGVAPAIALALCIAGILVSGLSGSFYEHIHLLTLSY